MRVQILDLGVNNLASMRRGLSLAGASEIDVIAQGTEYRRSRLLVLPGVGTFAAGMQAMGLRNFTHIVADHLDAGGKVLGVCLGMHLMARESQESPGVTGLSLFDGDVHRLPSDEGERVPHMGWSPIKSTSAKTLFPSLNLDNDYYFVHSYYVRLENALDVTETVSFGSQNIPAMVVKDDIVGVQFHPEKSSGPGISLLRDIISWANA